MEIPESLQDVLPEMLSDAGLGEALDFRSVTGGRNNRVYRVTATNGTAILKQHDVAVPGERDRFASEAAWYEYCRDQQVAQVPALLGSSPLARCLLLEDIAGRSLEPGTVIDHSHVEQAIQFIVDLNRRRRSATAQQLPLAAEACFSYEETVRCIDRRVCRLRDVPIEDATFESLHRWLDSDLIPIWQTIVARLGAAVSVEEFAADWPFTDRCLSPSDFGFHNARIGDDGRVTFLDFEYAGWDDPAKLVCDFCWQVQCPAPSAALSQFVKALGDAGIARRIHLLLAAYGLKWCTIVLNEFLRDGQQRRAFAQWDGRDRRGEQLSLARRLLTGIHHVVNGPEVPWSGVGGILGPREGT